MAESFLKSNQNKNELKEYLSLKLLELHQGYQIMIATYKNTSLSSKSSCSELETQVSVRPCEAEEENQRPVRHTLNLINNSYKNIFVCTINTDVLVLLISYIGQVELNDIEIHPYLIKSDRIDHTRTWFRYFLALLFFYAFTGCDTVSSFYGNGKRKAYDVWVKSERKDDFTDVFVWLGEKPTDVTSDHIDMLESFVLQLYGSRHDTLGAAGLSKFKKSADNDLRLFPPRKEVLRQHTYRAFYQAGDL